MINLIRKILPQRVINLFWHLSRAFLANLVYDFPSRKLKVIGVTGTDGKTTTSNMIYQILKQADKKVSMVSTINARVGGEEIDTGFHVTSPDSFVLQKMLKKSADLGEEFFVLEVTSHGLDQYRLWGVKFEAGVITNITHEHLDYHKTWENYFRSKAKLIREVRVAVLNKDENHFGKLSKLTSGKVVSFGLGKDADFNSNNFPLKLRLYGEFNVLNGLAAAAVCTNLGVGEKIVKKTLEEFSSLSGRMEEIPNKKGLRIVVDFAHTPNALEQALKTLRKDCLGKLIAVFGSAGLRDEEKRGLMGEIGARLADITVITAEDPRGQLDIINKEILSGAQKAGGVLGINVFIEGDRARAIDMAINKLAKKGDTVGIFGKGHERSMNINGKDEIPWSDQEEVLKSLS